MGGHDVMRMSMIVREEALARDREFQRRNLIREAKAADAGRIGKVTWFGGLKATAQFLGDSLQEAMAQRRMTEAKS